MTKKWIIENKAETMLPNKMTLPITQEEGSRQMVISSAVQFTKGHVLAMVRQANQARGIAYGRS